MKEKTELKISIRMLLRESGINWKNKKAKKEIRGELRKWTTIVSIRVRIIIHWCSKTLFPPNIQQRDYDVQIKIEN